MKIITKVRLLGHIYPEEIKEFIQDKLKVKVNMNIDKHRICEIDKLSNVKKVYGDDNFWQNISGFISFSLDGHNYGIFYSYDNINLHEDDEKDQDALDMYKSENTYLSINVFDNTISMLEEIISYFGGWIVEYSSGENKIEKVEGTNKNKLPIIHLTRNELNEKFGGIVIIDE